MVDPIRGLRWTFSFGESSLMTALEDYDYLKNIENWIWYNTDELKPDDEDGVFVYQTINCKDRLTCNIQPSTTPTQPMDCTSDNEAALQFSQQFLVI